MFVVEKDACREEENRLFSKIRLFQSQCLRAVHGRSKIVIQRTILGKQLGKSAF